MLNLYGLIARGDIADDVALASGAMSASPFLVHDLEHDLERDPLLLHVMAEAPPRLIHLS